jgi:hypothetical protein
MELRDNFFTEEQYLKQLAEYADDIKEQEEEIMMSYDKERNSGGLSPYVYLLKYRISSLVTMYSMGKDLECIKTDYLQAVKAMQEYWTPYGYYLHMLWLLSIAIMLDYEDDILNDLRTLIEQEEINDHVYDVLLNYHFPERKKIADCVFDNTPYRTILEVSDLAKTDKVQATKRLEKYLKKEWYRGHSGYPWYNDHKYGVLHDGYWSFESGALVKVLGLDDSCLKGLPYYPYDMVHWNDTK